MNIDLRKTPHRLLSVYWLIILVLVIAAVLRLKNITQPFIDDYSWRQSSVAMIAQNFHQNSWNIFYPEVNWVGPGPGYQGREFQTISYITALLYNVLGKHDWIGRFVVVLFALFGIFALYQLIRRICDEKRAIISAALLAISPGLITIERSFIPDPAMVALVVTSFWMLVVYLQTDQVRYLVLAALIGTLGNLTKLPGMIVGLPMAYATVSILRHRQSLSSRKLAILAIVGMLSALPVIAYYLWARHLSISYPPYHFAGEGNWIWDQGMKQWIAQHYFISHLWGPVTGMWGVTGIFLAFFGFVLPMIERKMLKAGSARVIATHTAEAPWLFHWWIAAGVAYYLIGARELVKNPSNLHIITPAVAGLSANAILFISSLAARRARRPVLSIVIAAALIVGLGIWELRRSRLYSSYTKQSYKVGLALKSISRNGDTVVALGDVIGCPVAIYYSGRRGWLFPAYEDIKDWERMPGEQEAIEALERLRAKGAKWFGIVKWRKDEIWKSQPEFAQHIERTCELVQMNKDAVVYRILTWEEIGHPGN